MNATKQLRDAGQSLWLDNITRDMLDDGTLKRYIDEYSVTGLTSNPTIFDAAIRGGDAYDESIRRFSAAGKSAEELIFALELEDLTRAADLFRPIHDRTNGVDGWASLEVSPGLARDTAGSIAWAKKLHDAGGRPNLFIKIPGTPEGLPAIEESIFAGVPINMTLLFSREQYLSAANSYLRGVERRIEAGLNPAVASVASIFVSRWDVAIAKEAPESLRNTLGIAVARRAYKAYNEFLETPRARRAMNFGGLPQRLLWASTGTKDPNISEVLYIEAFNSPFTVNTMPDKTLKAFAEHGKVGAPMPIDGGDCEEVLSEFAKAGIDVDALALRLQDEGADKFSKSWSELLKLLKEKTESLKKAG